jgi:type I restriction enzyme R subunit
MLVESGTGTLEEVEKAKVESEGLGLFVRSLVGLDQGAAKQALASFLEGRILSANQIEFVNIIVDNLTKTGLVHPGRLYEAPYTRLSAKGVDGVFRDADVEQLIELLEEVRLRAVA